MLRALAPVLATLLASAACGGSHVRPVEPTAGPDLSPALAPISWIVGDWTHEHGEEHWVATAGVLYGVGASADGSYELLVIDDAPEDADGKPDGALRLFAMPGGNPPVVFTGTNPAAGQLVFENAAHDDPTAIAYTQMGDQLVARVTGPTSDLTIPMTKAQGETEPEAEDADLAFAKDTDADGVEGWLRWFAADGAMIRGDQRVAGKDAIRERMAPLLGKASLLWAPVWSRRLPGGKLAVTVGRARIVQQAAVTWRGSYVTLWRRDPEGWRVVVDLGRSENPL